MSKFCGYAVDQDEYVKDALVSEIKIMRKFNSEYIVGFVDILETANNYYVAQEYCNGGDLRALIRKNKMFSEAEAINYLEQIWKSEYELVTNIMKKELVIPQHPPTSASSVDFLKRCLQEDENKRLSWQEVYEHPIFSGRFHALAEKNKKLSEKAGYVINKLRLEIHSQNIDMEKLFNKLKYHKATSLKREEFFSLLRTLDNSIDDQ
ncbi:unnamed protein product [Sphagnum balticum]